MAKPRVYITRPLPQPAMRILEGAVEYRLWDREDEPVPRENLLREVVDVDGVICLITEKMDAEVVDRMRRSAVIAQVAVGYDNIDVAAATRRGIFVTNTPGVLTETTADMGWAILMATARRVVEGDKFTRSGRWKTWELMGFTGQDVHGATLGIIGLGRIGAAIARRARGFAMTILYHNRRRADALEAEVGARYVSLDDLLRQSDFVMVSCALTADTRHLIGERELGLMKPTAVLVNIARGPIVDQRALYRALVDRKIWAAGLDVFEVEPVPMDEALLKLDNAVIPPHLGSASTATRIKMATMAAENCLAGVSGRVPPNVVNPEAAERR
ncbi:MAG: D-glycerate dehydrogenase [Bacillati bacterium ANGP1]|uniref:D-glycerate dehydrogenase n=1 Tax=Candidatus Segetimicrobium genomatis TaxID=2569760 RepID=A0A537JXG6_9BACT|nr:MAG: D-glycerate dehydrogenase [Terrabacteria group bacterium ANGP1]